MMDNPDLSLSFHEYLCDVIGTEDVVRKRRYIFTALEHALSDENSTYISSGSKAEGLDLGGSDFDLMVLVIDVPVYETYDEVKQFPGTIPFVMETTDCKLGFTLLKQYNPSYVLVSECENIAGVRYLSSSVSKEKLKMYMPGYIIHGPCTSDPEGSFDYAICVRCSKWILIAQPWILRSRMQRTSENTINNILQFGVLFVPIGCKNSPREYLEWRISFSYAERLLTWSFNHVQFICYALLKILLKDIIKPETGDLLCSYFLKTIMLWICEETESSLWREDNILSCFMICLNRLIYFVRHKTCPHYFVTENDLFANRFNKQQHQVLLSLLYQLKDSEWTCLLHTETLQSFKHIFPLRSINTVNDCLFYRRSRVSYLQCLTYIYSFLFFQQKSRQNLINLCRKANSKDIFIYTISMICQRIAQEISTGDSRSMGNKQSYNNYRKRLSYLLIGLNSDAVSGWLLLASHFYVKKQYQICQKILSYCLSKISLSTILLMRDNSLEEQSYFSFMESVLKVRPAYLFRHLIMNVVTCSLSSTMLPRECTILAKKNAVFISPVVYGLFLKFLCNHHIGNRREKKVSLYELEKVVQNEIFISNDFQLEQSEVLLSEAHAMMHA